MVEKMEAEGGEALTAEEQAFFESGGEKSPETTETVETGTETLLANTEKVEQTEETQEGQQRDEKGKFVKTIPFDVFHAEREEHKQTKQRLQELAEFKARMEERFNLAAAQQQAQQPKTEDDPEPDPNVDIFAHQAWQKRQIDALKAKIEGREQAEQKRNEATQQEAEVWGFWEQSVTAVKNELPDFGDAAQWLSEARSKQLQAYATAFDPSLNNPKAINQQIDAELRQMVITAKKNGTNPAKAVYDLAKSWGYTGPAPKQENGQLQLPEQLQRVAQAQTASRTIAQAPGKAGGDEITLETLDGMSQAELGAWLEVPANARRFQQLMGG
jgi:hypothetical protein